MNDGPQARSKPAGQTRQTETSRANSGECPRSLKKLRASCVTAAAASPGSARAVMPTAWKLGVVECGDACGDGYTPTVTACRRHAWPSCMGVMHGRHAWPSCMAAAAWFMCTSHVACSVGRVVECRSKGGPLTGRVAVREARLLRACLRPTWPPLLRRDTQGHNGSDGGGGAGGAVRAVLCVWVAGGQGARL